MYPVLLSVLSLEWVLKFLKKNTVFQKGILGQSEPPAKVVAIRMVVMRRMT